MSNFLKMLRYVAVVAFETGFNVELSICRVEEQAPQNVSYSNAVILCFTNVCHKSLPLVNS